MPIRDTWYAMTLNYLATPILCVIICIVIYMIMKKLIPGILEMIVGERNIKGALLN